ncbi:MAG: carboxypeptidase regulatory-like domain-containing protein, partial [Planctomycetales bacterium]|nr:carboxypeptidase regulatory-like domain-containing protein [Planctomycetales bacterium]
QIVNAQGAAMSGVDVAMVTGGKAVAVTKTDKQGRFAVRGVRGGQYDVVAGGGKSTFRVWASKTAPPTARNGALIVTGSDVVNGNIHGGVLGFVQSYPLLTAAAVTAAIAIPVGIAASDDDPPSTP